jgi:hypothetical protein
MTKFQRQMPPGNNWQASDQYLKFRYTFEKKIPKEIT